MNEAIHKSELIAAIKWYCKNNNLYLKILDSFIHNKYLFDTDKYIILEEPDRSGIIDYIFFTTKKYDNGTTYHAIHIKTLIRDFKIKQILNE
jgi:hypothetical protein